MPEKNDGFLPLNAGKPGQIYMLIEGKGVWVDKSVDKISYTIDGKYYEIPKEKVDEAIRSVISNANLTLEGEDAKNIQLGTPIMQDTTLNATEIKKFQIEDTQILKTKGTEIPYGSIDLSKSNVGDIGDIHYTDTFAKLGVGAYPDKTQVLKEINGKPAWLPVESYLTKEQIEAEGWEERNLNQSTKFTYFRKGNYMLAFRVVNGLPVIHILAADVLKMEWLIPDAPENFRVTLPCKDINTFRYICKLLEI